MKPSYHSPWSLLTACLLLALLVGLVSCSAKEATVETETPPPAQENQEHNGKIVVTTLADLPQHTYALEGSVSELLADEAAFAAFLQEVKADLEADLKRYQINDDATMQGLYGSLAAMNMLTGNHEAVIADLDQVRALEDKEAAQLTNGMVTRSIIAARQQVGDGASEETFREAFAAELQSRVDELPWDVVQDSIEESKGRAEIVTVNLILGIIQSQIDPMVAQSGDINSDQARRVVAMQMAMTQIVPVNDIVASVYGDYIAANAVEKPNIWPQRDIELAADGTLSTVVVGIWDSGVDAAVFGATMWTNAEEIPANQIDDDGNGFVDDVHGIAFDVEGRYSTELLHPLGDQAGKVDQSRLYMQGFQHVLANIDSPEASQMRKYMGSLQPEQVGAFLEGLSFYGLYAHGTHVSGIAGAGNPAAEILGARITFDYHTPNMAMTREIASRHADSYRRTAQYFQAAGVRVVNMSWGWGFKEIESSLEVNNVGASAEERAAMADEMLTILEKGLHDAMTATPGILYVVAAGNADNDVAFDRFIPAAFDLPNVIVVGAVDQAGEPTDFTSGGENVVVYANGFEVDSYIPGGERMRMSGTSMSAPQVTNLAAKLFAVDPQLDPSAVIGLIGDGADPSQGDQNFMLINPQQSVHMARTEG